MSQQRPSVADVGEFGLIDLVTARLPSSADVVLGPGDDAALVRATDGTVVATTDLLVEGQHFRLDWSTPYDVGRKAAAQNLADVAAMGARPTALLVGLAAPGVLPVEVALGIADGLAAECAMTGTGVAGGDVVRGGQLVLAITALGSLDGRSAVVRSGARAGQRVVVVGTLGGASAGLAALLDQDHAAPAGVLAAHRCPAPPYAAGPLLAAVGASAMVDTSDGFAADLGHVLRASGVGAVVDARALPSHGDLTGAWARDRGAAAVAGWVTSGGEDHALVATVDASRLAAAQAALAASGFLLADVGEVVDGEGIEWVGLPDGAAAPSGFDHFAGQGGAGR